MRQVAVLLIIVLLTGVARGDANDPLDEAAARRHFQKATDALGREDYEGALREFRVVRAIKPLPDLDYNIARCLDALERWKEAAVEYRKYLASGPDAVTADIVRRRVIDLERRVAVLEGKPAPEPPKPAEPMLRAEEPPVTPVPPAPTPPVPSPSPMPSPQPIAAPQNNSAPPVDKTPVYRRWWLWTTIGVAAVGIGLGVGLGLGLRSTGEPFRPTLEPFGPNAPEGR